MIQRLWHLFVRNLDGPLLLLALLLMLVNLAVLFSASNQSVERIIAQLMNMSVALTVMWLAANISPQKMMGLAPPV